MREGRVRLFRVLEPCTISKYAVDTKIREPIQRSTTEIHDNIANVAKQVLKMTRFFLWGIVLVLTGVTEAFTRPQPPSSVVRPLATATRLDLAKDHNHILVSSVLGALVAFSSLDVAHHGMNPPVAQAREMSSGSGSRVNKDAYSLLRYGLPIPAGIEKDSKIRQMQVIAESMKIDLLSKRLNAAADATKKITSIVNNEQSVQTIVKDCGNAGNACSEQLKAIRNDYLPLLSQAIQSSTQNAAGSEQERAALDAAYRYQSQVIQSIDQIEQQLVAANGGKTQFTVPPEYANYLPTLQNGRAVVEMTLKKKDAGDIFQIQATGQSYPTAKLTMVVDGYTAPVTSGNFIDLVQKGFYNNMKISRSDGFVVQSGDPSYDKKTGDETQDATLAVGYVGAGAPSVGQGPHGERLIPLEILVKGDAAPIYEQTMEDVGKGGNAVVLPFSAYGAMGWAREEYDPNSGSSQFFWLLFDSDLTPAGKNVLDGRYPWYGIVA
jgi:peptidylprolyl isomerase